MPHIFPVSPPHNFLMRKFLVGHNVFILKQSSVEFHPDDVNQQLIVTGMDKD